MNALGAFAVLEHFWLHANDLIMDKFQQRRGWEEVVRLRCKAGCCSRKVLRSRGYCIYTSNTSMEVMKDW